MKNRGYITIFVSLMLLVILLIAMTVITINDRNAARAKVSTSVSSVMSSEMANYNRLIFDRYHVLLLDKCASGAGEGAMEVSMEENLKTNLGNSFEVKGVEISGTLGIMDDGCSEFKKQINENFKYNVIEYSVDKIIEKTKGEDTPIGSKELQDIDNDIASEKAKIESESDDSESSDSTGDSNASQSSEGSGADSSSSSASVTDPRDSVKKFTRLGLAGQLLPENAELGTNVITSDELPSDGKPKNKVEQITTSFTNISRMKMDAVKGNGWAKNLATNAEAVVYGASYFNCLTDQKYDDTFLRLEMEYIIAGEKTDGENYKKVVDEIMLIRFGMNLAYILSDSAKMAECDTLALALTAYFPPAEPVVKYLLAGCWAYIESVADVYLLLRGHSVPFMKTMDTWNTDMDSLSKLGTIEKGEAQRGSSERGASERGDSDSVSAIENGLDYKEYLMILMALKGDTMYYRMLDIMQLNVTETEGEYSDPTFRMCNAITAFGANVDVSYKGMDISIHEETGY